MYLPDPRTEVVVKRKLTPSQCELWFPGNRDALQYNMDLSEKAVEKSMKKADLDAFAFACSFSDTATMANLEAKANISRGTSYTKPRTITLDNKFEGVVSMDIWTGYAVNVISKNGDRKVVCGPQTILLDYDQTLEVLQMSTGKPKSDANMIKTVYLRHENNKVSDVISIETKDFVRADIKVSYCVDFDPEYMNKWFAIENYVKYLCDRERALIRRAAKNYTIEELYQNYSDIVRNIAIDADKEKGEGAHVGRFFSENGMYVHDCEVLSINVEAEVAGMLEEHQHEMVRKALKVADAERRLNLITILAEAEKSEQELRNQQLLNKMNLQREEALKKLEIQSEVNRVQEAEKEASKNAELNMQVVLDAISAADRARRDADFQLTMEHEAAELAQKEAHAEKLAAIEKAKSEAYAETVAKIMGSITPELVASLEARANADVVAAIEHAVAPYAIAGGEETVTDVAQRLIKGTAFEDVFKQFGNKQ
jgi:major vault protein